MGEETPLFRYHKHERNQYAYNQPAQRRKRGLEQLFSLQFNFTWEEKKKKKNKLYWLTKLKWGREIKERKMEEKNNLDGGFDSFTDDAGRGFPSSEADRRNPCSSIQIKVQSFLHFCFLLPTTKSNTLKHTLIFQPYLFSKFMVPKQIKPERAYIEWRKLGFLFFWSLFVFLSLWLLFMVPIIPFEWVAPRNEDFKIKKKGKKPSVRKPFNVWRAFNL